MKKRPPRIRVRDLNREELWEYALKRLGARALSAAELRARLARRAESEADAEAVMARLKEYGYLDDRRFADSFAAARVENQGHGRQRVLRDLRGRRVPATVAREAVDKAYRGTDETTLIRDYLQRKFRNVAMAEYLGDEKHVVSVYRKLRYAGFSSGNVIRVLKSFSERAEELDSLEEAAETG